MCSAFVGFCVLFSFLNSSLRKTVQLHHAKDLVTKVMNLKPFMLSGQVEEVFRSILMDKELMEIFNVIPSHPMYSTPKLKSIKSFP